VRRTATIALAWLLAGCSVPIGHFTALALAPTDVPRPATGDAHPGFGRSCRWWILGLTFGLPRIDEALADALAGTGARRLRHVELTSVHPVYGPLGRHCYTVAGDVDAASSASAPANSNTR
jgi:hypothetical protein